MSQIKWDFTNKTALVTGGSRGIGAAIVKALAEAGAKVIFTYSRDELAAQALMNPYNQSGLQVKAVQADFLSASGIQRLIEEITGEEIDYLVNNAGLLRDGPIYKMPESDWGEVVQVNLNALFSITKKLIPTLAYRKGSIVNISSVSGISGAVGQVNYCAAKAGVNGFTKALAREVGPLGIRVNAIAPGFIETDMLLTVHPQKIGSLYRDVPLRRLGKPEDVAEAALFMLSDSAAYMTGTVMVLDGGLY